MRGQESPDIGNVKLSGEAFDAAVSAQAFQYIARIELPRTSAMEWLSSLRAAAAPFWSSRLLILLLWAASAGTIRAPSAPISAVQDVHVIVDAAKTAERLRTLSTANDAGWYLRIAQEGYEQRPFSADTQAAWAFFPLHPFLWGLVLPLTGDDPLSGLLLAHLTFLLALIVVHRLLLDLRLDDDAARRALWFLCFCPTTYFFSLPWTESLFLLLTAATWLAFERRAWPAMAALGIAATACRFASLFLVVAVAVELWRRRPLVSWRSVAACMSMPAGLLLFMVLLWTKTGDALAFAHIQSAWAEDWPFQSSHSAWFWPSRTSWRPIGTFVH